MRSILALALMVMATPALAQVWGHYSNDRFGYSIEVPPGFTSKGDGQTEDGQVFHRPESEQELTIWGGELPDGFEANFFASMDKAVANYWRLGDEEVSAEWTQFQAFRVYSGMTERHIVLCDGTSFAAFRLEYPVRDLAAMEMVTKELVRSFVAEGC